MIYKAENKLIEELLNKPESGMGYQIIEAKRPFSRRREMFVVYNSEMVVELEDGLDFYKKHPADESLVAEPPVTYGDKISLTGIDVIKPRREDTGSIAGELSEKRRYTNGKAALDNALVNASGKDTFVRLSAYYNDRRIDTVNKKLRPGSYTTTLADYLECKKQKDNPVDRYALPNVQPIAWAFYIEPKASDTYQEGIVQPANGRNGGGLEAFFARGTSDHTFLKTTIY